MRDEPKENGKRAGLFQQLKEWWSDPYRDRPNWTDKAIVALTMGIVLMSGMQWWEMHTSGTDTRAMADAAKQQAASAKSFAESADKINKGIEAAVDKLSQQAGAAKGSAEAAQQEMELNERPWVKIELGDKAEEEEKFTIQERVGGPFTLPIKITNSGTTPAKNIEVAIQIQLVPKGQEPNLPKGHLIKLNLTGNGELLQKSLKTGKERHVVPGFGIEGGRLFAGAHAILSASRVEAIDGNAAITFLAATEAANLASKDVYVVMAGEAHYSDGFGVGHWTRFCSAFFGDGAAVPSGKCAAYSKDDNNWSGEQSAPPPN